METLVHNKKYEGTLKLSGLEILATNSVVEAELRKAGFTDVVVVGAGQIRKGTGVWKGDTQPLPAQYAKKFSSIKQLS
jgi:hypothetical protein